MKKWKHIIRLARNKATLTRVLSEREFEKIRDKVFCINESRPNILVAGGGKSAGGSESAFLDSFESPPRIFFVDIQKSRAPDIIMNLTATWPFKDETFHLIISTWVVEHLAKPELFFHEAFRVLQDKGMIVCTVPFIYRKHGSPWDYYRFTDTALLDLTHSAGFGELQIHQVGGTPFVCCVSVIWPFIPVPVLGVFLFLIAYTCDKVLELSAKALGKKSEVIYSYPLSYIVIAKKNKTGVHEYQYLPE